MYVCMYAELSVWMSTDFWVVPMAFSGPPGALAARRENGTYFNCASFSEADLKTLRKKPRLWDLTVFWFQIVRFDCVLFHKRFDSWFSKISGQIYIYVFVCFWHGLTYDLQICTNHMSNHMSKKQRNKYKFDRWFAQISGQIYIYFFVFLTCGLTYDLCKSANHMSNHVKNTQKHKYKFDRWFSKISCQIFCEIEHSQISRSEIRTQWDLTIVVFFAGSSSRLQKKKHN